MTKSIINGLSDLSIKIKIRGPKHLGPDLKTDRDRTSPLINMRNFPFQNTKKKKIEFKK